MRGEANFGGRTKAEERSLTFKKIGDGSERRALGIEAEWLCNGLLIRVEWVRFPPIPPIFSPLYKF